MLFAVVEIYMPRKYRLGMIFRTNDDEDVVLRHQICFEGHVLVGTVARAVQPHLLCLPQRYLICHFSF